MKKLSFTLFAVAALVFTANAAILFYDPYTVSGGGDANFEYISRQSGSAAPISYQVVPVEAVTVTNAGTNAGKLNITGAAGQIRNVNLANHNFIESSDFSIEFELTRLDGVDAFHWLSIAIGTDGAWLWPSESGKSGLEIRFWEVGQLVVYQDGAKLIDQGFNELKVSVNPTLKIKLVVSQPDFIGSGNAKIALFVNNKALQLAGGNLTYTYKYIGGFTNNYINLRVGEANVNIDNFKISTANDNLITTAAWTDDADSGVNNAKVYTHAVNLNDTADIVINSKTFTGAGVGVLSGTNWEIKTPNDAGMSTFAERATSVAPAGGNLLTNFLYPGGTPSFTLTSLTPGQQYIFKLYSMGFETGNRNSFFATSDGAAITTINQDEFDIGNGQILSYQYIADTDGVFTISATPQTTLGWHAYAFSNEMSPPASPKNVVASQAAYNDKIVLTWDEQQGSAVYSIFRAETNDSFVASLLDSAISNNYTDSAISLGRYYYYWVKASNSVGTSDFSNSALGFSKSAAPETPTNLSPVDFNVLTSPVVFTATVFSDPSGFIFTASEWQISDQSDFSDVIWGSGESITKNYLTTPISAGVEGTNFWRVRYKNNRKTWSAWSAQTSFILVKTSDASDKFFDDSFNCPDSGDVNNQYYVPGRQTGSSSPLTYRNQGTTEAGNSSSNPGQLTLGSNSGCSINESFNKALNFKIEFEVEPHKLDGTADGFALCFGKSAQSSFAPNSESGAGLVFLANGEFYSFDSETFLNGGSVIPTDKKMDVTVSASVIDFEYETAVYTVFANGIPMIQDANYGYIDTGGFGNNYITMFSSNSVSTNPTVVDNIDIQETYKTVTVTNWTSDADSFVDSSKTYTHTVNLNGDDVEINSVTFIGAGALGNTNVPNNSEYCVSNGSWEIMSSANLVRLFDGGDGSTVNISGDSKTLAKNFCWWGTSKASGNSAAVKLSGLTPFSSNRMTIYTYAFESVGRDSYFSSSSCGMITNVSQNFYGTGNGLLMQYDYVAAADGTFTIVALPATDSSFHIAAFSNEETAQAEPKLNVDEYLYFGEIVIGNSKTMPLEIKNLGGGVVSGAITGASPEFILTNSYFATALTSDIINVEFMPVSDGSYTNVITLTGSGGNAEVTLIGSGIPEPFLFIIYYFGLWIIYSRRPLGPGSSLSL